MKIVGFDPGTARIGWAVIAVEHNRISGYRYGCFTTQEKDPVENRLLRIFHDVTSFLTKYKPDCVSIEALYFSANAKTAIPVGQARGVLLLACAMQSIGVVSYSPNSIKRTITGDGNADKKQIQYMVRKLLRLTEIPKPDDAADAVAIALTHAYSMKFMTKLI